MSNKIVIDSDSIDHWMMDADGHLVYINLYPWDARKVHLITGRVNALITWKENT